MKGIVVRVGHIGADINGVDHRALQAAVDYVAGLGGGTVEVLEGEYAMYDSLHLRSHVAVRGAGESTLLRRCDGVEVPLRLDGDYGEEQITVVDPTPFRVGMGVSVRDDRSGGFHTTVGTLIWQDGDSFGISTPLQADCMVSGNARAAIAFPVVSGYYVESARIENLTIDGSRDRSPYLNGCRGAGIFLYRSHGTRIERCRVSRYHGDGISFQQSNDVVVRDCLVEECSHLGLHPGSGSQRPTLVGNRSRRNDDMGIFLCWRVRHGVFEANEVEDNKCYGFSIGHKDTDNTFVGNRIVGNGIAGIHFRDESEPMAGHRNRFADNEIASNGMYGFRIDGETHDILIERNRFAGSDIQRTAVSVGPKASRIVVSGNALDGQSIENEADDRAISVE